MEISHFGITKPPNNKTDNIAELPAVTEAPTVWKKEAINRNMDIDVKWTAKSRRNWRKNLEHTLENVRTTVTFKISNKTISRKETEAQINNIRILPCISYIYH